jgi:hypothetical protein
MGSRPFLFRASKPVRHRHRSVLGERGGDLLTNAIERAGAIVRDDPKAEPAVG